METHKVVLVKVDGQWQVKKMENTQDPNGTPVIPRDVHYMERVLRVATRRSLQEYRLTQSRQKKSKPEGVASV